MSSELDEVARALYNGQIPSIWRALAPATLKSLGNWISHFLRRNQQYITWVKNGIIHIIVVDVLVTMLKKLMAATRSIVHITAIVEETNGS